MGQQIYFPETRAQLLVKRNPKKDGTQIKLSPYTGIFPAEKILQATTIKPAIKNQGHSQVRILSTNLPPLWSQT